MKLEAHRVCEDTGLLSYQEGNHYNYPDKDPGLHQLAVLYIPQDRILQGNTRWSIGEYLTQYKDYTLAQRAVYSREMR